MSNTRVLPYFHPTTVVAVDDSELFSLGVELRLPPILAFESFSDPQCALDRVNQNASEPTLLQRIVRSTHPPNLELADIQNELARGARFERATVAVVDYAMPAMSGVELCSQIVDPLVRKILITGVADQRLAMRALNNGQVDRCLVKGDRRMFPKLISYIRELQRQYFIQEHDGIDPAGGLELPAYSLDTSFSKCFEVLRRTLNIVEYYSVSSPPGVLMATAEGEPVHLDLLEHDSYHCDGTSAQVPTDRVVHLKDVRSTIEFASPCLRHGRLTTMDTLIRFDGDRSWLFRIRTLGLCPRGPHLQASYSSYLSQLDSAHANAEL